MSWARAVERSSRAVQKSLDTSAWKLTKVPIELLRPKVRVRRDVGDLLALADSIREYGILQPLVASEGEDGKYEILLGYRRYLAALEAGLKELPVISLGRVDLEKALELILREDLLRFPLRRDERCLIVAALAMSSGVRRTARALRMPPSTVESAKKAGMTFKGVWKVAVRSSHKEGDSKKLKVKVKLAEKVYEAVSKVSREESFEELAGRIYLMLMDFPTKTALRLLDKWLENPTLDYMEKLVSEAAAGGLADANAGIRIRKIEERVPITLDDGKPVEEVLASYSWSAKQRYEVVEEDVLKVVEFREGFPGVSGLVCPRCQLPIRCRVCGALVNCICGFPDARVRHRKYRYALRRRMPDEKG